ncbi:MAG: RidA family protein, partial [Rhodobacteraceae bacterium]|nr:RidA family protein [Paracoccaceae bacterium]MYI90342.1 RidA family protein [Paracoccaceae bacterium]
MHARLVGLNILSALRLVIGDLEQVERVIKLQGLVNASPDFERHSFVIDGASELMKEVFGERGVHARTSFGVSSLPNNITVEIDGVFALRQEQ